MIQHKLEATIAEEIHSNHPQKVTNRSIPCSAAALIALMFAVPLILYIWELEPKPPTQEI
jgi:hypothetical protein